MTTPTTTPGTLGCARPRIAATPPTNERPLPRRAPRGSLLASLLATAVVALAVAGAQADPHPDHRPTYKVTADLDGRTTPAKGDFTTIEREDFLRKGQRVPVIWANRAREKLDPSQKKPTAEVHNLREAAKLLGAT